MVHAHGVVGGDRAVQERPRLSAAVLLDQLLEALFALPEGEDLALEGWEI